MAWSIFREGGGPQVAVGWAEQLLKMIGAPVTPGNVQMVYDWETSEGGGGKFNPLNQGPVPGQPNLTTTGSQYGGGAADFASWQAGLQGAADYLAMPAYSGVRDALRANQPVRARSALIASPWAASHYGGGSAFSNAPVPGGKPVLPPSGGLPGNGPGTGASAQLTSADTSCLWQISGPLGISGCVLSQGQGRAVLGFIVLSTGGIVLALGVVIMAAYGLSGTAAGLAAKRLGGKATAAAGRPRPAAAPRRPAAGAGAAQASTAPPAE